MLIHRVLKITSIRCFERRTLSLSRRILSEKPPSDDKSDKALDKTAQNELTDGIETEVKVKDFLKPKKVFYSRKEVDQALAEAEQRRLVETPGERNARLAKEMEPIFKEVADMDQLKYELAEYKQEKAASLQMKTGLISGILLVVVTYIFVILRRKELSKEHQETKRQTFGKACLEGNFELIETATGDTFSSVDLLGKWGLVYFGFTRCPDVCPEQLEKLAYVIEGVNNQKEKNPELGDLEAFFISIDTARDTFEQINDYCKDFHPQLKGLSGTETAVDHAAKSFRIYFSKGIVDDGDENYLMDHSIVIFLVNPEGKVEEYFTQYKSPGEVIFTTIERMKLWTVEQDFADTMRKIDARKEARRKTRAEQQ